MRFQPSTPALVAVALIVAGTLSVRAQQPPAGLSAKAAGAPRAATVTRTAASKMKTNSLTTIQGNALNSTNGPLNDVAVRLRDARFGTIVDTQITDKSGLFAFKSIDPGSYIVEVMSSDQTSVLAASQLLNIDAGQAMSAVVKLPFRIPPFAGIAGSSSAPSATAIAAQAAATSIVAVVPTDPISPIK
jgi:PDZ domain-containing secreted protein